MFKALVILLLSGIQLVETHLESLSAKKEESLSALTVQAALSFLGTPYVANTLEVNEQEELVINLRELDCTTLVENSLALAFTRKSEQAGFLTFQEYLLQLRYRKGRIEGYTSRLHYASDWLYENEAKGYLKDITRQLGGKQLGLRLDFMSTHPQAYKHLSQHPEDIARLEEIEKTINQRTYHYIPKEEIARHRDRIQSGDIIFFVTTIKGLDISHMGIAYHTKGMLSFIHASSKAKKVIVNPESLADYCLKSKSNKGIIVCRLND